MTDEAVVEFDTLDGVVLGEPVMIPDPQQTLIEAMQNLDHYDAEAKRLQDENAELLQYILEQAPAELREQFRVNETRIGGYLQEGARLVEYVKTEVKRSGQTVVIGRVTATFRRGSKTADIKMLEGMAALYPAIAQAFRYGEPSVAIKIK